MNRKIQVIVGYGCLFTTFLVLCIFMNMYIDRIINVSDSNEMTLAWTLSKDGGVMARDWFYSLETGILSMQLIWRVLFQFTANWHFVRIAGNLVIYVIMLASIYFFCKKVGLARWYPLIGILFLLPFSPQYFEYVLKGGYHAFHITVSFLLFALMFSFRDAAGGRRRILLSVASVLSLCAGLGGMEQLAVYYLPLLAAVVWYEFLNGWRKGQEKSCLVYASVTFAFATVGYLVNRTVLSRIYCFSDNSVKPASLSLERMEGVVNGWAYTLGFKQGGNIFTADLICNAACAVVLLSAFYSVSRVLRNREEYCEKTQILAAYFLSAFITNLLLYSLTNRFYEYRLVMPCVIFAFPLIFACMEKSAGWGGNCSKKNNLYFRTAVIAVMMVLVFGRSLILYRDEMQLDLTREYKNAADALVSQGYVAGYTTSDHANILTEFSNGEIEVWAWNPDLSKIVDINTMAPHQQRKSHEVTLPGGRIFVLLTDAEKDVFPWINRFLEEDVIYRSEYFTCYGFASYDDFMERLISTYFETSNASTAGEEVTYG